MKLNLATKAGFAEIDTMGAQLMSLRDALGTEYLWQGDPRYWAERSPLLFPMVGRLRGGKTLIGGREYSMGCHGFASAQEFRPVMQSSDSVTLSLRANEQTLAQYPFDFHLLASYQLADNRLSVSLEVMNLGDLNAKFRAFGWSAIEIDGHCIEEILHAFDYARETEGPVAILAHTIKGKGVSFMENQVDWHGKAPNEEETRRALAEIMQA